MEAVFLDQRRGFRLRQTIWFFSLLLLRPIVKLGIDPEGEDAHLTKLAAFRELLFIVEHAERLLADDVTDQPGFLVCFLARDFGRLHALSWASLWVSSIGASRAWSVTSP